MSQARPRLVISGTSIPILSFNATGGNYGSTGSLVAMSSTKALTNIGFNLVKASIASPGSLPVDLYCDFDDQPTAHLFSGEYLSGDYDYDGAQVTIHARDWSGPLVDQKRVLSTLLSGQSAPLAPDQSATSTGTSTQNQKVSQLVTAIANLFSLTPDLRLAAGTDGPIGAQFGTTTDTILTATPQSLWAVLAKLAKQSGNVVYVTPEKHLVFGAPGAGLEPLSLSWGQSVLQPGQLPVRDLKIKHNPRRNLTFRVLVLSYNPTNQQMTQGQAYVIGTNFTTTTTKTKSTVSAGAWYGADAQAITNSISSQSGSTVVSAPKIPVYTFHRDGLTADQAQAQAQAIAQDISKRELVVECEADVIPGISPSQTAMLSGNIDQEFQNHTYYVTGYSHVFRMARSGNSTFDTTMSLLDEQPAGVGKSVSQPSES